VHRLTEAWRDKHARAPLYAFVTLSFAPGEAFLVRLEPRDHHARGLPLLIKAAHMKLSHSCMPFGAPTFARRRNRCSTRTTKPFDFMAEPVGAVSTTI
jgi:hypothetical protein